MNVELRNKWLHQLYGYAGACLLVFSFACGNPNAPKQETATEGRINISVDESFRPVIDSQLKVFASSWPDAVINVHYKPEAACFRDLSTDSTRMIIVTRGLTSSEEQFYKDSFHLLPSYSILAWDAVAVIVNNESKHTVMSMEEIRHLLDGTSTNGLTPVMDGTSATSTVQYAMDSILKGKPLGKNVVAAHSSEEVINYVSMTKNAVGFVGVSWLGDLSDPQQLKFLEKVKIVGLPCANCLDTSYVQPWQANIKLKRYPLIRGLYYILKENFSGVGSNFANFLQYERGQMIFQHAYLYPARMNFEVRDMQIKQ